MAAEDAGEDMGVSPQQLIGGINGMILQLHKMHVELEESRNKQQKFTERVKDLEMRNENSKDEIDNLTKAKERLTEQSEFLQKSLKQKKAENAELSERLKQAEIQLGESGSVLETVRNLESKNEILSVKMSSVVISTEEEIAKAKTEREHYLKLYEETKELNDRNLAIQKSLEEAENSAKQHHAKAKALVEKTEKKYAEIVTSMDEMNLIKEKYLKFLGEKETLEKKSKKSLEANSSLQRENKELKKKIKDLDTRNSNLGRSFAEHRKNTDGLKEQLARVKREKEELYQEVNSLCKHIEDQEAARSSRDGEDSAQEDERTKHYEVLEEQVKLLAENYGKTTQQLDMLKESVDESKDLLKAKMSEASGAKSEDATDTEDQGGPGSLENSEDPQVSSDYLALVVEMQGYFKHSDVRDEELASLEKLAGIPEQRLNDKSGLSSNEDNASGISSCIRGLVAMKDNQINSLAKERDELAKEVTETKKTEYRQQYVLNETIKEKDELLAKIAAYQEKYRRVKKEKEDMRQELLVKNATEKMTHDFISDLKQENDRYKSVVQKQQETLKRKYAAMKGDFDKQLQAKDKAIQTLKEKLVIYQHERDSMKTELNSRQLKDNAIKEQIISIFGK